MRIRAEDKHGLWISPRKQKLIVTLWCTQIISPSNPLHYNAVLENLNAHLSPRHQRSLKPCSLVLDGVRSSQLAHLFSADWRINEMRPMWLCSQTQNVPEVGMGKLNGTQDLQRLLEDVW